MPSFEMPPLIPRDDLFGNPEKAAPQISPDGKTLAYLAPDEDVLNVWVRTVGQDDDRVITRDRKRGIRAYFWPFDGKSLIYAQDADGDENWHLWSVDLAANIIRDLTPFQGVQARVVAVDERFPHEILVSMNVRDARFHDVYRIDLRTGATTMDVENNDNVVSWVADSKFQVRASTIPLDDGGFQLRARESANGAWKPLITWGPDEEGETYGFTSDDQALYVGSTNGSNTQELRTVDIASGAETTLASNPGVDLSDILAHPTGHHIQAVGFNEDRLEWQALDPSVESDLIFLRDATPGELHVASQSKDDRTWIVLYVQDQAPASYYVYDRGDQSLEFLFTTRPALEKQALAEMRPVHIRSRDGLLLHSYLTLPPGVEPKDLPLVLHVHGGPWARDTWGYNPEAQWLANRGYACLQVNFRGSTGFGKQFLHAADREWGGKMHDDLLDSIDWAVAAGIADRRRVGIYGGSYGGYAALVGAAFTPDVFACAVDIVGPSSLRTLINSIPPYWEPLKRLFTVRVGDPEVEPEFLDGRSPLYKAHQIQCPMLIAQGANDPRVKQAESEQIVEALRSRGKTVEYVLFEDEGHGFARPENRLKFYGIAEKFLAQHLGGRVEE